MIDGLYEGWLKRELAVLADVKTYFFERTVVLMNKDFKIKEKFNILCRQNQKSVV